MDTVNAGYRSYGISKITKNIVKNYKIKKFLKRKFGQ